MYNPWFWLWSYDPYYWWYLNPWFWLPYGYPYWYWSWPWAYPGYGYWYGYQYPYGDWRLWALPLLEGLTLGVSWALPWMLWFL